MYRCDGKCDTRPIGVSRPHTITLQTVTETQGSNGEVTETWAALSTKRASIEPITGREYWDGNQTLAEQSFIVKTSYDSTSATITPKGRILFGTRVFDIITKVNPEELDEELHFMCKERL